MALPSATRLDRMPLGLRVILVGLAAGVLLWLLLDRYQTQWIEEVFREDLTKRLEERARSDRLRLDQRIRTHFGYIGVLVGQAEFLSQITDDLKNTEPPAVATAVEAPLWLPRRSLRRLFVDPDAFIVVDMEDRVRKSYRLRDVPLPARLLHPEPRLVRQAETEPLLLPMDKELFLIAAAQIPGPAGEIGRLVGVTRIDGAFLVQAQGAYRDPTSVVALVSGNPQRILMSTDPARVMPGAALDDLRPSFLLTGKGFFDYGFAEADTGLITLMERAQLDALSRPVLSIERRQRTVLAVAIGGFFILVMAYMAYRLRRVTARVAAFSQRVYGVPPLRPTSGDELANLEYYVERLTREVLTSRVALEAETQEKLCVAADGNRALERAKQELETRVEQRTRDLQHALLEAQKATAAKSRFLAAASHDLRQPLQAVRLFEEVLRNRLAGSEVMIVVDRLGQSIGAAEQLLSALLDISKIEAGVVEPEVSRFRVGDLLREVGQDFELLAAQRRSDLRVMDCGAVLETDRILLGRVIRNLVSNAIRHAAGRRVLLGCRRAGSGLRIEVWDQGPGIPPEQIEAIFEEFYQLGNPERDREKGLGLGLSIAKKLATLCGISLEVRSVVGAGSVFALHVQRVAEPPLAPRIFSPACYSAPA